MARLQTVTLGSQRRMQMGKPGASKKVITGRASGVGSISASEQRQPIGIPGGEAIASTLGTFVTRVFTIAAQSNDNHDDIFRDAMCQRLEFTWEEAGEGNRQVDGEVVVAGWGLTFRKVGSVAYTGLRFVVDGNPVVS